MLLRIVSFSLPDLTHPEELQKFGQQLLQLSQGLLLLLIGFGIMFALVNFSYRRDRPAWLENNLKRYSQILFGIQHGLLVIVILVGGFFLTSTLANRYHHWEQARISQVASTVAGERVEQPAPQLRYQIDQPYTTTVYIDGKPVEVERTQRLDRFLPLNASQAEVKLKQITDPATSRLIYQSAFRATYQLTNPLNRAENFIFDLPPPYGYTLLQSYQVERDGQPLQPQNQGDSSFPLRLASGESTQFRVSYQAQGAPRWVYNANGRLLANFRLNALADFPNAAFASGIVPTATKVVGQETLFTWSFKDNVSVQNPFGVFTATPPVRNTGILPRLLLLAPGVLLWWLLLLYLSVPLRLQDVLIAAGIFFACLLALTYTSRLLDAKLAWGLLSPMLLLLGWGLGRPVYQRWRGIGVTLSGAVLPMFGLLVPYTGLTLAIAGLISATWLIFPYFQKRVGI